MIAEQAHVLTLHSLNNLLEFIMSIADYSFEESLARAATLPSSWYTGAEILELEKRKVFGRAWQLVGRAEQVQHHIPIVHPSLNREIDYARYRTETRGYY